ncbi:MAG: nitrite/sulfite reductase, partial [Terriglobia bacterium]
MYRYDEFDARFVRERVEQFRYQVERRLSGELSEVEFKPLRLMNGVYLQLHSYMLRIAVPYGTLSSRQLRKLAYIARRYDRGYGHFTTRTNLQFHWPALKDVPDILEELAQVEMHAIQTSGNCIRNVTADQFAGATGEEIEDPRPLAEIIRQWSSLHPEFVFLPRKFKIAVGATETDRAALQWHDMAVQIVKNDEGRAGYLVMAGGGMGRTPYVAHVMNEFVGREDILAYLEAVLRVYNQDSRRDNIHKQRIKILINTIGPEEMRRRVAREFEELKRMGTLQLPKEELDRITAYFKAPDFETGLSDDMPDAGPDFANWVKTNVHKHKA